MDGSILTRFDNKDYSIYFPKDSYGQSHYCMNGVDFKPNGSLCIFAKKKLKK